MNSTTLLIVVVCCFVSRTFGFDNDTEEEQRYLRKVQRMVGLDFGHGQLYDIPTGRFPYMTVGELKVTSAKLHATLECSYTLNLYVHSQIFRSYMLLESKPHLTADEIEIYAFVKEAQRMLTTIHDFGKYSTAKYIVWAYLVYTEKMADAMRDPEKDYSLQDTAMVVHQSVVNLLTASILNPLCEHLYYEKERVLSDWPVLNRNAMDYREWTRTLTEARNIVLKQLDFNDRHGVSSADDGNAYSLDALHLKGVFDQHDKLNYVVRQLLMHGNWRALKFRSQGMAIPLESVDFNLLKISPDSFRELQMSIQTDCFPSLVQRIIHMIKFLSNFVRLLKTIPLQLVNSYLLTVMDSMAAADSSCVEDRVLPILDFNREIANQLKSLADSLDLGHDRSLNGTVQFFFEISNRERLSLKIVSDAQKLLDGNLKQTGKVLIDGPIIKRMIFEDVQTKQPDSSSTASTSSIVHTEQLRGLVDNIKEIVIYIRENIANLVNFKGIHSFKEIEFSQELATLMIQETALEPQPI